MRWISEFFEHISKETKNSIGYVIIRILYDRKVVFKDIFMFFIIYSPTESLEFQLRLVEAMKLQRIIR